MSHDIDPTLRALAAVAPPPELDVLVKARARAEFVARSAHVHQGAAPAARPSPARLPEPERWVYALAVILYGGRAVAVGAQLIWRAVLGQ